MQTFGEHTPLEACRGRWLLETLLLFRFHFHGGTLFDTPVFVKQQLRRRGKVVG